MATLKHPDMTEIPDLEGYLAWVRAELERLATETADIDTADALFELVDKWDPPADSIPDFALTTKSLWRLWRKHSAMPAAAKRYVVGWAIHDGPWGRVRRIVGQVIIAVLGLRSS